MSTKNNVLTALGRIFSSEVDIKDDSQEIIMIHPALIEAWGNIEKSKLKKETEEFMSSSTTNGGTSFKKEYKAKEINNGNEKEKLERMSKILKGEKSEKERNN